MVIMVDNYDSFTYNLVQYLEELGADVRVWRNDRPELLELDLDTVRSVVISPGPGRPQDAGLSVEVVKKYYRHLPILGVCLGHQAIAHAFGGRVVRARRIMHGKVSLIRHDGRGVYRGIKGPFEATRYHSLIVERDGLPSSFIRTAHTPEGEMMGIRHRSYPLEGVQFHPESILTGVGKMILNNFLLKSTKRNGQGRAKKKKG